MKINRVKKKSSLFLGALVLFAIFVVSLFCKVNRSSTPAIEPRTAEIALANRTMRACGFPTKISNSQTPSVRGTLPYVLATTGSVDKVIREDVIAAGARVIGVLSRNSFLIESTPATLSSFSSDARFAAAEEFLPSDKIDPRLRARIDSGADAVDVTVVSLSSEDRDNVRAWIEGHDGEVLKGCLSGRDSVTVRVPVARVGELARLGEVRYLEAFTRPKLLNNMAVEPVAMNVRNVWNRHGLTGEGQIISTSDSGIDTGNMETIHPDFRENLCGFGVVFGADAYDSDGHGTHTAGSIVGDGTMSDGEIRGVAYGAKLWAWFCNAGEYINLPNTTEELFRPDHENYPAYIHSASWGEDKAGAYDNQASVIDWDIWEHPDFLMVVAAGNDGQNGKMTVGSPATAKNVLSVGATQNTRTWDISWASGDPAVTTTYSSRGPCCDGRIKPDIAAPGTAVLSTAAAGLSYHFGRGENTNYAYSCGTSMATPLTAGAVALVREWLMKERGYDGDARPTAALMKAVITGGAKDAATPNNEQGWGRVDLEETLFPSNRAVKLVDRIPFATGTNFTYIVQTTNAAPLDVQLVWIDHPGTEGAAPETPQLVNDLNLIVDSVANNIPTRWLGNGGDKADDLNTTESVRISAAPAGTYVITVECANIVYDHEEGGAAALYIRGAFDPEAMEIETDDFVTLTISATPEDVQSQVSPAFGSVRILRGIEVDFSASEYAYKYGPLGTASSKHEFVGYQGTGDVPNAGSERNFKAVISNDSTIVWQYNTVPKYYLFRTFLSLDYVIGGEYPLTEKWCENGETFKLLFPKNAPYGDGYYPDLFVTDGTTEKRTKDNYLFKLGSLLMCDTDESPSEDGYLLDSRGRMQKELTVTMDRGRDLYCRYYWDEFETSHGLPYWWAMRYLYGCRNNDDDLYPSSDPDGDGFTNAMEVKDDTDPMDDESFRFSIDDFSFTNMTFTCSKKGTWVIETSDNLDEGWTPIIETNSASRASITNSVNIEKSEDARRFYRVRYRP